MLLIVARSSNTSCSVHWGGVSAALGLSVPGQPDVATLSPPGAPAVPHNPVVALGLVGAVADQLDSVVESNVTVIGAARVDSRAVPSPSRGVHGNSKRADLSKVGHDGLLVVGGERVVAGDANSGGSVREVVHAVSSFSGGAGGVRVVGLHGVAKQLDVSITKLRDGAIATSSASTGKRVRGTRRHLFITIEINKIGRRSICTKNKKFADEFDWFQCL